jgi:KDO2-lipid IV(A) lauroyltransferase
MDKPLYLLARGVVSLIQSLPLEWVARLGRFFGGLVYWLDARHRRVAVVNLTMCFGQEKTEDEIRALAKENFRRIGENFACAAKTAGMTFEQLKPHVEFIASDAVFGVPADSKPSGIVGAIGHFGNFELYARCGQFAPAYQCATTYRGLRQPSLDKLLLSMRGKSGCRYFERRFDGGLLKAFMNQPGVILGLLSDQHAGEGGLRLPFFGHDCSTSAAPALFALRYRCALYPAICFRVGLARWRIEAGERIATHENGKARSKEAIMRDVNRAFEAAVRRDPANWFWVHNRWKLLKKSKVSGLKSKVEDPVPHHEGNAGGGSQQ